MMTTTPQITVRTGSQLEKSYRSWIRDSGYPESEAAVVLHGTVVILRRHSIHGTICSECGNDDPDLVQVSAVDKLGFITEVECLECGQHLSTICRNSNFYLEKIRDPSVLERGDHVGWYRGLAYWHHGIVISQCVDRLAVVGYTVDNPKSPFAWVTVHELKHTSMASLLRGTVYRIKYDDCYTNEYAALRAQRTVGEEKYDFFEQNCEHAAKWCKTGLHGSDQLTSGFAALGVKVILRVILRALVLSVLWMLQFCRFVQGSWTTEGLWIERGINIAYMSIVVTVYTVYSIYKDCSRMKSSVGPSLREPHDDSMESFRKDCTNSFFSCCCNRHPKCSRLTCSVCCLACFCCSLCQATFTYCAWKIHLCSVPCCGRPVADSFRLVLSSFVREVVAASGAFLVVWFMDDIVPWFEGRGVIVSGDAAINRAVIVIIAIMVVSLVTYPLGVLLARWVEGLTECCCCPWYHPSHPADFNYDENLPYSCPVHEEIVDISGRNGDYHMTNISILQ